MTPPGIVPAALVAVALSFAVAPRPAAGATPPSIDEARAQLGRGEVDDVFLMFSSVKRGAHPAGDVAVAALLVDAARASLAKNDATLALGFSDKARALDGTSVDACLAGADAAIALQQRGVAEEALDAALRIAPKNWAIVMRRATFAEEEGELAKAIALFKAVPAAVPYGAEAARRLRVLSAEASAREAAIAETKRLEQQVAKRQAGEVPRDDVEPSEPRPGRSGARSAVASSEERVAGMAARSSRHFRIVYSEGQRDFAEKAQYEQRVLDMFERAHGRVTGKLRHTPGRIMDVVLYTREEFELHFGGQFPNGVAGFYSGKIRMNRAESLDDQFYKTAVHEYAHAVIDSLAGDSGRKVPMWLNEGIAEWLERDTTGGGYVSFTERAELRAAAREKRLMRLADIAQDSFASLPGSKVHLAYWKSSCAVECLVRGGEGLTKLSRVIENIHAGFEHAFAREFGDRRLAGLDDEITGLIGK